MLTKATYEISREDLKHTLRYLLDLEDGRFAALNLVRSVTGWSINVAKDYIEGGMIDVYPEGSRVTVVSFGRDNEVHIVVGSVSSNGTIFYWLKDDEGDLCTYNSNDIVGLAP